MRWVDMEHLPMDDACVRSLIRLPLSLVWGLGSWSSSVRSQEMQVINVISIRPCVYGRVHTGPHGTWEDVAITRSGRLRAPACALRRTSTEE